MFSIVITYYNGINFLNDLQENLNNIAKNYYEYIKEKTEVIIVNDNPLDSSLSNLKLDSNIDLIIINNKENVGIHQSRVNGINVAHGKYIIILDQDDKLVDSILIDYSKIISSNSTYDLIVSNGWFEDKSNLKHLLYTNSNDLNMAISPKNHYLIRNFITSPGQCLIKKAAIPEEWKRNIIKNNGCDDTFLWLLMFNSNAKIFGNQQPEYIHKYSGSNTMLNKEKMYQSKLEMIQKLETITNFNKKNLSKIRKSASYKYNYKKNFFTQSLFHPYIFYYNVKYRIKWKGYTLN